VAREGFLKDKCGPRAKKFERHCFKTWIYAIEYQTKMCSLSKSSQRNQW